MAAQHHLGPGLSFSDDLVVRHLTFCVTSNHARQAKLGSLRGVQRKSSSSNFLFRVMFTNSSSQQNFSFAPISFDIPSWKVVDLQFLNRAPLHVDDQWKFPPRAKSRRIFGLTRKSDFARLVKAVSLVLVPNFLDITSIPMEFSYNAFYV